VLKSFIKFFTGNHSEEKKPGSGAQGGVKELENFVDYVVRALVDFPDAVRVTSETGEDSSIIKIDCKKEDIGKIVGKKGKTIMAIRALVSGAAGRLQKKVSVEVND
jgi:predicted RNA-binding protein YlqC (UPF0109 family)